MISESKAPRKDPAQSQTKDSSTPPQQLQQQIQSLFQSQPDPDAAVEALIDRLADADLIGDLPEPELSNVGQWLTENPLTASLLPKDLRTLKLKSRTPAIELEHLLDALEAPQA